MRGESRDRTSLNGRSETRGGERLSVRGHSRTDVLVRRGARHHVVAYDDSPRTTIIKKKHGGPRAELRIHHDHGMHRGWHHGGSKTVIIKKHGHRHYD